MRSTSRWTPSGGCSGRSGRARSRRSSRSTRSTGSAGSARARLAGRFPGSVAVSALTGEGADGLLEEIGARAPHPPVEVRLLVPVRAGGRHGPVVSGGRGALEGDGHRGDDRARPGGAAAVVRDPRLRVRAGLDVRSPEPPQPGSAQLPVITVSGSCPRSSANRRARSCSRTVSGIWARSIGSGSGSRQRYDGDPLGRRRGRDGLHESVRIRRHEAEQGITSRRAGPPNRGAGTRCRAPRPARARPRVA